MAELVRPKKPKNRERSQSDTAPPIPSRSLVVNGVRLPDVPSHILEERREESEERASSPEPEELVLSDAEIGDNEEARDVSVPMRPAPAPPQSSSVAAPPLPPRTMIFPRSTSMIEGSKNESLPPVAKRSLAANAAPKYPAVPELAELPSYDAALEHPKVYPQVVARHPMTHSQSASALPPKVRMSEPPELARTTISEAPPLYPSICTFERNDHGLMTEENLLTFYHNPLYGDVDGFVDRFIQAEEVPLNPGRLFPLLKRFKETCDELVITQVKEKENTEDLQKCLKSCWKQETLMIDGKAKCSENKDGTGKGRYHSYILNENMVREMRKLLNTNRTNLMDYRLCQETIAKSLALQIQWQIILINNNFMAENGLSMQSPPNLAENLPLTPHRIALRSALSDLFYHLRFPRLPQRYVDAIVGWIRELICILNMRQSSNDGIFVLCHILRLPSPIDIWSPSFVQTFIQSQTPPKQKFDYCIALLTHLLNPIRARESFLRHVAQSEKEESAWGILEENEGEADEFSFVTVNETDLTSLFDQIPISELYSIAYLAFTSYADKGSQFTAMVAFQLLLMKILDNGLTNYAKPGYKMFCKQIGISLKHSVRELCSNWRLIKNQVSASDEQHLQKEVDRVVLLALNYLIHRDSVGLFQFVVDLPYGVVSEECRNRCEFTLRSTNKMPINEIYDTSICEVQARIKLYSIKTRIASLQPQDAEFLVNSLASIGSYSNADVGALLKELIDVCFCDEVTRDNLYKCGGEAVSQILSRRPETLQQLLSIVDRSLQHMDSYAINVISTSKLFDCRLTESMISIIGKWLINHPPDHGGNRLARRVLSGLHWGPDTDGQNLWIDAEVHEIAADTIIKAHSVHCPRSNSMISKSLKQIAKVATKVGQAESTFQQFCWDLLVKLKIPKNEALAAQNDLTAHYVNIVQKYESSVSLYLEKGVPLLSDLVSSGSSVACVVLVCRMIAQHYEHVDELSADKNFISVFERILHVDQLSYAVQWFTGPSATPTPIVSLICSAISYYATRAVNVRDFLRAWLQLLCLSRTGWNEDPVTYQIIGSIVRIAFINNPMGLYDMVPMIQDSYTKQLIAEKNASKGLFSVFSTDPIPSPLIPDSMLGISPFASYLMLLAEPLAFGVFYQNLFDTLAKKDKYTLEDAVKKATAKSSMAIPIDRISVFRWAKLVDHCKDLNVLPLILQQLTIEAYKLRKTNTHKLCFARKVIDAPQVEGIMNNCKKSMEESNIETKGLTRAAIGWLFTKHEVTKQGFNFSVFDLDYLLQLAIAGDTNIWTDYVNFAEMSADDYAYQKFYSSSCQLTARQRQSPPPPADLGSPRHRSTARPFPVLPVHSGLPKSPIVDPAILFNAHAATQLTEPFLKTIRVLSKKFGECADKMGNDDDAYCSLIKSLYQPTMQKISVEIRCSPGCSKPRACEMQVNPNVFNAGTDAQMSDNRTKRIAFFTELDTSLMAKAAVATASIEHLSRMIAMNAHDMPQNSKVNALETGRSLFFLITSSVDEDEILFLSASDAFVHSLKELGSEFIKFNPNGQLDVMQLVLNGFVLPDPLVEVFTPEVLNSHDLLAAYTKLSEAVRMPQKSKMALQLLGRLGMQQAAAGLPPHQFAALLPIAFANLASQPDPSSSLHILCLQHVLFFVFHQFPANFPSGLDLALDGCNSNSTPSTLLDGIVEKLGARNFKSKNSYDLGAAKSIECSAILSKRLDEARTKLPTFYNIYSRYLDPITRLAQHFVFIPIRDGYIPNKSVLDLQRDLYENFARIVAVFSPLIAPYSPTHPPFSPSHDTQATLVLDRFVELLNSLHFNSSIPPGMQNVQSLVWQFYFEKLSILSHGTQHYYDVLERQLVRLDWQKLWPSRLGLSAMEQCLDVRSPDCASFVAQIVVRIDWNSLLMQMNESDRPAYLASLFGVLSRIVSRARNYEKVRASFLEKVKSLSSRMDWKYVSKEDAERISLSVSSSLPSDSVVNQIEVVSVIHMIWRKICGFVPSEPFSQETLQKQSIWLKTECSLLLKCDPSDAPAAYNSLISDVNSLAVKHTNLREFCLVAQELTALWKNISDSKLGESLVHHWTEYLAANPNSPLVLTSLNTLMNSLNSDQLTTSLKVMEKTIEAYFSRTDSSWGGLMHWIGMPNARRSSIKSYLLTVPTTENKVLLLPLTLTAFLNISQDDKNFYELHNYVTSIKPKHVQHEAAFLCLLAKLVHWLAFRSPKLSSSFSPSDDLLTPLIRWLNKSSKDDSSFLSNLISSKKTAHSPKLRIILQILELYITQQTLGEGKRPRCEPNAPVLNSRIQTLKEFAQQKSNQQMTNAFNKATAYFVQVDTHHIQSAHKLILETGKCTFGDRFFSDV